MATRIRKTSPAQVALTARASRGYWQTYAMRPDGEWFVSSGDAHGASGWAPCADPRVDGVIPALVDLYTNETMGAFRAHDTKTCNRMRLPLDTSYSQLRAERFQRHAKRIGEIDAMIIELEGCKAGASDLMMELIESKIADLKSERALLVG